MNVTNPLEFSQHDQLRTLLREVEALRRELAQLREALGLTKPEPPLVAVWDGKRDPF